MKKIDYEKVNKRIMRKRKIAEGYWLELKKGIDKRKKKND